MNGPDFIVAGFPKCGTTALYHNLNRHAGIYMARTQESDKMVEHGLVGAIEMNFWNKQFDKGVQHYRERFREVVAANDAWTKHNKREAVGYDKQHYQDWASNDGVPAAVRDRYKNRFRDEKDELYGIVGEIPEWEAL